jgi:hypothetical protein
LRESAFFIELKKRPTEALLSTYKKAYSMKSLKRQLDWAQIEHPIHYLREDKKNNPKIKSNFRVISIWFALINLRCHAKKNY